MIAAVRGWAVGGGLELALACHLRIAGRSARFGQPEILRGHIPGAGGTVRLPRLVGIGRALQYLLTGDDIPADEAERIGLVNFVVADDAVLEAAEALGRRIAGLSEVAVRLTLQSVIGGATPRSKARLRSSRHSAAECGSHATTARASMLSPRSGRRSTTRNRTWRRSTSRPS